MARGSFMQNSPIHSIGIDIGGTNIKAVAFADDGTPLAKWTRATRDEVSTGLPPFAAAVRDLLDEIDAKDAPVGIATPGLIAADGRSVRYIAGKMHGLSGLDWGDFLQRDQAIPLLNDGHAALLGEAWCGAARHCRHAILLTLGTGVGGAILADGRLLTGAMGRAGHLGHVSVNNSSERSIFGTPGSIEAAIGNYSIAKRSNGRFESTRKLVEAVQAGDVAARKIWERSIHDLARAITSYINILDPEIVIIGGGIAQAGEILFDRLNADLADIEWQPTGNRVPVVPSQLGEWAGAYGAARQASLCSQSTPSFLTSTQAEL